MDVPQAVVEYCRAAGLSTIVDTETLKGGMISRTQRLMLSSHATLVLKQSPEAPEQMYQLEAEGLRSLRIPGVPRTPEVLAVGDDFLPLEDLGGVPPHEHYWEEFGRALALQHRQRSPLFGFAHDNYLGRLRQINTRMEDGHEFFVQHRVLRYLSVPLCEQTLTAEDRRGLERLCVRIRELVPPQPAALLHGDLWRENMAVGPGGEPAVIDPAVYYGWPEAELAMVRQCGGVPDEFFAAYCEVNPLADGWWDRLELLYVRESLSMIAHFGNVYNSLAPLRTVMAKFA